MNKNQYNITSVLDKRVLPTGEKESMEFMSSKMLLIILLIIFAGLKDIVASQPHASAGAHPPPPVPANPPQVSRNSNPSVPDPLPADDGLEGHSDTIIKFSYDDNDPLGPTNWDDYDKVRSGQGGALNGGDGKSGNHCKTQWVTPLNIQTHNVVAPEEATGRGEDDMGDRSSLTFFVPTSHIENLDWEFGHPSDSYHGLEIRAPHLGTFQLNDRFDPIGQGPEFEWIGVNEYTNYDFTFGAVFYCDPAKASPKRSMHQIDGVKYPLEIDLIFLNQPPKIGIDNIICDDATNGFCDTIGVMVAILGEFANEDNKRLEPLIAAAAMYEGPDWGTDDMDEGYVIPIKKPWSPSWLLPDASAYFYYEAGSFPVPPCWMVGRVYVIKETIKISRRQFNMLTSVRSKREKGGRMPCTYSQLQTQGGDDDIEIKYNQYQYSIKGEDSRPMTIIDKKRKLQRDKAAQEAKRQALARRGIVLQDKKISSSTISRYRITLWGNYYLCILVSLTVVKLVVKSI